MRGRVAVRWLTSGATWSVVWATILALSWAAGKAEAGGPFGTSPFTPFAQGGGRESGNQPSAATPSMPRAQPPPPVINHPPAVSPNPVPFSPSPGQVAPANRGGSNFVPVAIPTGAPSPQFPASDRISGSNQQPPAPLTAHPASSAVGRIAVGDTGNAMPPSSQNARRETSIAAVPGDVPDATRRLAPSVANPAQPTAADQRGASPTVSARRGRLAPAKARQTAPLPISLRRRKRHPRKAKRESPQCAGGWASILAARWQ